MVAREVRLLANRWAQNRQNWPQFLEWLEVSGLRGWEGQRVSLDFPMVAIVGENGAGKSTLLQAAASIYRPPQGQAGFFASEFFPTTTWEDTQGVTIRAFVRQGASTFEYSVRKPTSRWLGNPERRQRAVRFLDLRRTQPIYARLGYAKIAKRTVTEASTVQFSADTRERVSAIMGKTYDAARQATTNVDPNRSVPILQAGGVQYSGFHQGAGENTVADLLSNQPSENSLLLIDEIETSLHPRAQRRLIRDFAALARLHHLQIVVTTHSPYVLEELPPQARIYIRNTPNQRRDVLIGVSSDYAMTFMDDDAHPELDLCVEDDEARILVQEILSRFSPQLVKRVQLVRFGAANVGQALGQMVAQDRFPRPTVVCLDADQEPTAGVVLLPGDDAPERVVFEALSRIGHRDLSARTARSHPSIVDALTQAQTRSDHHDWLDAAASDVTMGGLDLWRAMCSVYVEHCLGQSDVQPLLDEIEDRLGRG